MIARAFQDLYPEKPFIYETEIKFSNKLKPFNANIRKQGKHLSVHASSHWKDIGEEIQLGLYQTLLMKLFKEKKETLYTQLYVNFIRNVGDYTPATQVDETLLQMFSELNEEFFDNLLDIPNLRWGKDSTRQIGLYNYHSDTITLSSILKEHPDVAKYVLYHELLHKKEKFTHKNGRSRHHTTIFRKLERSYPEYEELERKISYIVRKARRNLYK